MKGRCLVYFAEYSVGVVRGGGGGARWGFELPPNLLLAFGVLEFGFLFTGICVCEGLMVV